ncbi:GT2D2 protein, partial [Amia calva]|nr:GT2D2 protein [Amia calva]
MHGTTTANTIFQQVERCVDRIKLPWEKLVGLTTEVCLLGCKKSYSWDTDNFHCIVHQEALCVNMDHVMHTVTQTVHLISARGLNHRQFQAFLEELNVECGDLPNHTEVCWLSLGIVLRKFVELRGEIRLFLQNKGRQISELSDESWLCDLAFLCDVTEHLNTLNMKLQGRKQVITEMHDSVKAFQLKLRLWEKQMQQGNLFYLPSHL